MNIHIPGLKLYRALHDLPKKVRSPPPPGPPFRGLGMSSHGSRLVRFSFNVLEIDCVKSGYYVTYDITSVAN